MCQPEKSVQTEAVDIVILANDLQILVGHRPALRTHHHEPNERIHSVNRLFDGNHSVLGVVHVSVEFLQHYVGDPDNAWVVIHKQYPRMKCVSAVLRWFDSMVEADVHFMHVLTYVVASQDHSGDVLPASMERDQGEPASRPRVH